MVNGAGQADERGKPGGFIADFQSTPHLGYVAGDAAAAYEGRMTTFRRHVLMIRPSVVIVVDELAAPSPARFDWLMHTIQPMTVDNEKQTVLIEREAEKMRLQFYTPGGVTMTQNDEWPLEPRTGFDVLMDKPVPFPNQWHLNVVPRLAVSKRRLAAIFHIADSGTWPSCDIQQSGHQLTVRGENDDHVWSARIDLETDGAESILRADCRPDKGPNERIEAK